MYVISWKKVPFSRSKIQKRFDAQVSITTNLSTIFPFLHFVNSIPGLFKFNFSKMIQGKWQHMGCGCKAAKICRKCFTWIWNNCIFDGKGIHNAWISVQRWNLSRLPFYSKGQLSVSIYRQILAIWYICTPSTFYVLFNCENRKKLALNKIYKILNSIFFYYIP